MFGWKRKYESLHKEYLENLDDLKKSKEDNDNLKKRIIALGGEKGNCIKENKKLVKEITDLKLRNEQLELENAELHKLNETLLSNRYKVRKIKGTHATKEDKSLMGLKRGVTNSKVKKELKKKNENLEKEGN